MSTHIDTRESVVRDITSSLGDYPIGVIGAGVDQPEVAEDLVSLLVDLGERAYANARELHEHGTGSREEFLQTLVLSTIDDVLALAWLEPVYLLRLAEVRADAVEGRFADREEVCRFVREHPLE